MKIRSYNKELAISSILFSKLFRNITINRTLANNTVEACKVACVIGTRSRILKAFENGQESTQFTLPLISISRSGIARDPSRLSNLHNEIKLSTNSAINYDLLTPNPINIDYKVSIYAKWTADIDMILSNFMVFFNDDIYVSSDHPKYTDIRYYSQVIMQNSVNETRNETLAATNSDLVMAELSFTFKTFIFGGSRNIPAKIASIVKPITAITEITVIDSETGKPKIDPATSSVSVITTQVTGTKTEIYDGYIPLVTSLHTEFHAVPRYDPFKRLEDGTRINYDFTQYFTDVDNNSDVLNDGRKFTSPEADYLDWIIDGSTIDPNSGKTVPYNV